MYVTAKECVHPSVSQGKMTGFKITGSFVPSYVIDTTVRNEIVPHPPLPLFFSTVTAHTAPTNRRDTSPLRIMRPTSLRHLRAYRLHRFRSFPNPSRNRKRSSNSDQLLPKACPKGVLQFKLPIIHIRCRRIWLIVQPEPPSVVFT